jgi:calcineurin-like phosphoesterase family protein
LQKNPQQKNSYSNSQVIMRDIYVISDTHFGHENILKFVDSEEKPLREFHDVWHMNEHIIDRWNKTVKDNDIVYHLGDVYFSKGHEVLPRLRGHKRLILGNHDDGKCEHLHAAFEKILMWREFKEFDCIMTHVPIHESSLYKRKYNLHGHVHKGSHRGLIQDERYINCCVEVRDYTPIAIEELVK